MLCVCLVLGCALAVFADNSATMVNNMTTITSDGTCSVTLRVTVHLDSPNQKLTFPVPLNASEIEVNGNSARVTKGANALEVDLSKAIGSVIGDYSVQIDFELPSVVRMQEGKMLLELPLVSGFIYPVRALNFTVTLPAEITTQPSFTASYQQSHTDSLISYAINNNMISGQLADGAVLKDHETLVMNMVVTPEMFRGVSTYERTGNPELIPMAICAGLALLYWLIFLRTWPMIRVRRATPPEGVCAGELGCRLTFAGADLTMMVFTWAQLGYILIQQDRRGRVILHKRMEMGNERSLFEVKCYRSLFGKDRAVDATGYRYAKLCLRIAQDVPGERAMCKPSSGNIKIFRLLNCGISLFGGMCLGMNMGSVLVVKVLLAVILGVLGAYSAWFIQQGMYRIHIRGKLPLYICDGLVVLWLVIGIFAGQILVALWMVLAQLIAGAAAAYGGKRSEMGRQNATQILGLRHYLQNIPEDELKRLLANDPEFFYNLAPYAIAMGADRKFSKIFGKRKMRPCPYFVSELQGKRTAQEWAKAMRHAADLMDARQRQMQWEKFAIIRFGR